ncbi:MAG: DEAD/DEAH box helicase family protein [Candidatus Pacebacteria bacterium]|nr:DEAD/DEAH box helicase family protein [Candidatus Paceibacterota bacterium]
MAYNEDTRVKIPAILHLCRLGYKYLSLKTSKWDVETNIFTDIFFDSIKAINKDVEDDEIKKLYEKISLVLDNEDLGKEFYEMLLSNEIKLIDFDNFDNNSLHVVTELTCKNGDEEFRPDITLLINGMPLAFIEVKKPNNREGIIAERNRINTRFQNKKFRKFINITQLLVFSNNMEYDSESIGQVEGAYYSSTSHNRAIFNAFKEDVAVEKLDVNSIIKPEDEEVENYVLKDNNLNVIKHSPEFITNKDIDSPTNRILSSLFSRDRLSMLLRYAIAYVKEHDGLQKHVMRYPQFFATKAIEQSIDKGIKKGIIWHTQGSGKTALSYYNVKYLTDYFQKKQIIPKFYFIVDRLDLLIQAKKEFSSRGLVVHTVNSKDELLKDFQSNKNIHNLKGQLEITVVNIQKFKEDTAVLNCGLYSTNIQRIYFLDEVHRSYDPKGSFLANLMTSDREAIIIGLTGTPLIGKDKSSKAIFGDYIHKYYYNSSIADGYTLKLIREDIETSYKIKLQEALKDIKILKGDADKRKVYSHPKFVEPMLDYIVADFDKSRIMYGDDSIGALVVCDSSDQAKKMFEVFNKKHSENLTASLILHDIGTKDERKDEIDQFKEGKIDFLFVYNMLLTGFDAKRLKKLYLGRVIKKHNLLQTLTRVNRPYKDFHFGYVVDFADIRKEFDATNKAYFDELQDELGDEMETYSNIFLSKEEIESEIEIIKDRLFRFDLVNAENFSKQISAIQDKQEILEIKKALMSAKNLYNIIRLMGHYELLDKIDFKKLAMLYNEAENHLNLVNLKDSLENNSETTNLLNVALEDVIFTFRKVSEEEMVIADKLKNTLKKTREEMGKNFDKNDKEFVALYEELRRLFDKKNLDEITQEEMSANIKELEKIYEAITDLNRRNNQLKAKYENDEKYARIHKRILEERNVDAREITIFETLTDIKKQADQKVLDNARMIQNEDYFIKFMSPIVIGSFENHGIKLDNKSADLINNCATQEYLYDFNNTKVW